MLDPNLLNTFLVAAETLNFSRAAERLHLTQPSVTQHIHSLENHYGETLFERTGNRLSLTEAGHALLPIARQVVTVSLRADEVMEALKGDIQGHLVIGCSTTPGKYLLPVLLAEFMRRYPRVQATCQVTSRVIALQALEQSQVHLAFSSNVEEVNEHIEIRKFISDPVVLIAPLGHPLASKAWVEPEELRHARFILREDSAGTYRVTRNGLARLGINIESLQNVLTLGNSEAIAIAVQEGLGLGFVSEIVVRRMVEGKVATLNVRGLDLHQEIYICRHRLTPQPRVQAAFWDFLNDPGNPVIKKLSPNQAIN
jgi:DNA-binding transcriptional LysR family regulator